MRSGIRKSFGSQTPLVDKKFKSNKNFDAVYATDQKTIKKIQCAFAVQKERVWSIPILSAMIVFKI